MPSRLGSERLDDDEGVLGDPLEELSQHKVDELQEVSTCVRLFK